MDFIVDCMKDYIVKDECLFRVGKKYKLRIENCAARVMYDHDNGVMFYGISLDVHFKQYQGKLEYEDYLPEMTDDEYSEWYKSSILVDGVRMGYEI
jgi:hypothetical protein